MTTLKSVSCISLLLYWMVASKSIFLATFVWLASSASLLSNMPVMDSSDSLMVANLSSYPCRIVSYSSSAWSLSDSIARRALSRRIIRPFILSIFCESRRHCGMYITASSCTTRCSYGTSRRPRYPQSTPTDITVPSTSVVVPITFPTWEPYISVTFFPIMVRSFSVIATIYDELYNQRIVNRVWRFG